MEESFTDFCKRLEHFETPKWAAEKILEHEILTRFVFDPCCGTGILSEAAKEAGYFCGSTDIHDWGYKDQLGVIDFFECPSLPTPKEDTTIFINPPFSKACEFVEKSFELGARKVVCFQRFAWWESGGRKDFWEKFPPNRVYVCADRASCWRHDIPESERGSGTPTAHAWFVWERGNPSGTLTGHIRKDR